LPKSAPQHSKVADAPARRAFSTSDGLTLVGDAFGDREAPPVLLLHGGGQTRHAWEDTARALAAGGFYALALDQRGHGESSWSAEGRYAIDAFAGDLCAVARALGRRPALVGASLGGLAAILAEGEATESVVSALILVDVAPRLDLSGVARIIGFMTAHPEGFASIEAAADSVAAYLPHRPRPKDLSGLAKNLRRGEDGRFRWHWDPRFIMKDYGITPEEFTERLLGCCARIKVPTLLVRGKLSDVLSEEASREFIERVPHAELVDVADALHMVAGDRNDRFTEAVLAFLSRLGAAA
jgi:pimeloyl-ACP methyl ester carboxylesterase